MSTAGAADEWDLTIPEDPIQLAAELARHGAKPGRTVHMTLAVTPSRPKRKSAKGLLVGKIPANELLTDEDFDAVHEANVEAAERRYGSLDL